MKRELVEPGVVRGQHCHPIEDGRRVECDLCPRACRLQEGQSGFRYERRARADGIDLTSYGTARDVYNVTRYKLDEHDACELCGCQLQGRFGAAACSFGRRRIPITIAARAS